MARACAGKSRRRAARTPAIIAAPTIAAESKKPSVTTKPPLASNESTTPDGSNAASTSAPAMRPSQRWMRARRCSARVINTKHRGKLSAAAATCILKAASHKASNRSGSFSITNAGKVSKSKYGTLITVMNAEPSNIEIQNERAPQRAKILGISLRRADPANGLDASLTSRSVDSGFGWWPKRAGARAAFSGLEAAIVCLVVGGRVRVTAAHDESFKIGHWESSRVLGAVRQVRQLPRSKPPTVGGTGYAPPCADHARSPPKKSALICGASGLSRRTTARSSLVAARLRSSRSPNSTTSTRRLGTASTLEAAMSPVDGLECVLPGERFAQY